MKLQFIFLFFYSCLFLNAQLHIDTLQSIDVLVEKYFVNTENNGVRVNNIRFTGSKQSIGLFHCEYEYNSLIKKGIIVSTGNVFDAVGPNNKINCGTVNLRAGDNELENIANGRSFDAAVLEFEFTPFTDSICFRYIFASEEYPEYVSKGVNDIFAFFIKDVRSGEVKNIALLPSSNDPVSVDFVNQQSNEEYYIQNELWNDHDIMKWENNKAAGEYSYLFQFDGMTKILSAGMKVTPFTNYFFKLAIADVGDALYDSWVLLESESFVSNGRKTDPDKDQLKNYLTKYFPGSKIISSEDPFKISVLTDITFEINSSELSSVSLPLTENIYQLLLHTTLSLEIHGYTDDTGTEKYNKALSEKRAAAVADFLLLKGINKNRLKIFGEGMIKDIQSGITDEARAKNRKVEFVFYPD